MTPDWRKSRSRRAVRRARVASAAPLQLPRTISNFNLDLPNLMIISPILTRPSKVADSFAKVRQGMAELCDTVVLAARHRGYV